MILHFDDPTSLTGARITQGSSTLYYNVAYNLEFTCVAGAGNTPVDMQSLGCTRWELKITKSLSTPSEVLLQTTYTNDIAAASTVILSFCTGTRPMYEYVAGSRSVPVVLELKGYIEDNVRVGILLPMLLKSTSVLDIPDQYEWQPNDGTLTITYGDGTILGHFSADQAEDTVITIPAPDASIIAQAQQAANDASIAAEETRQAAAQATGIANISVNGVYATVTDRTAYIVNVESTHTPVIYATGTTLTATAGSVYHWTIPSGASALLQLQGQREGYVSWTRIDVQLGAAASITPAGMTMVGRPEPGRLNKFGIDYDGTNAWLYLLAVED